MKIKPQISLLIAVCIFATGIIASSVLGLWSTESNKTPDKIKQEKYSDSYNPADIRGSYSFSEISSLFKIPIEDMASAFKIDADKAKDFKCKDLENIFADAPNEIGTGSVKMFVAYYLGLPYEMSEDTYLTNEAVNILKEKAKLSEEQISYLESHIVSLT